VSKEPRVFTPLKKAISNLNISLVAAKTISRQTVIVPMDELETLLAAVKGSEVEFQLRDRESKRVSGGVPYGSAAAAEDYRMAGEEIVTRLATPWEVYSEDS